MGMNDYLIFGASGLTGNNFLKEVKDKGSTYHLFVRSLIDDEDTDKQTIFCQENIKELPLSKNLIICLGYPLAFQELIWMNEETKRAFKEVDLELVLEIARKAKDIGVNNIAVISAVGSRINSLNYYLNIKAEMEQKILDLKFKKTFFAKPGHLLGFRDDSRIDNWVRVIEFLGKIYGYFMIGPLKKYRNVEAKQVAKELFNVINDDNEIAYNYLVEVNEG
tara:strand:- start:2342 stop:3004 length:663 start_codon:yes stop_codon:yes gene_type:complete